MKGLLRPAISLFLAMTLLAGVAYPLLVTTLAQTAFPAQAAGSVLISGNKAAGSSLIGQPFDDPRYFWGRPSATTPQAYNGGSSSGSNLGPTNPALVDALKQRIAALRAADPGNAAPIPVDLVTASGSGLDPEISPAAARFQIDRVARARHMDVAQVRAMVDRATRGRTFGALGEPRVNVLELNLLLDRRWP